VSASAADARIRSLRPARKHVDPYTAHGSIVEEERRPGGRIERGLTVFLAGAECPFTCSFCDLWQWTFEGPTPPGALANQLAAVLRSLELDRTDGNHASATGGLAATSAPERLKIYNASNFFDSRAVPLEDAREIVKMADGFSAVTVESHANTIGPSTLAFAREIPGKLEVAVGLETIHPTAAAQLNKRLDLARFDRAAAFLAENDIDLRVFVLLGAPFVEPNESVAWTLRTVEYAVQRGAAIVSIIPVRGGNGEMERLEALGKFTPPTLSQLEDALDASMHFQSAVVTADLWDAERLIKCDCCGPKRIERMRRMNLTGSVRPRVECAECGAA
jgi:radical SAM enzyme (TIGR01210 family)